MKRSRHLAGIFLRWFIVLQLFIYSDKPKVRYYFEKNKIKMRNGEAALNRSDNNDNSNAGDMNNNSGKRVMTEEENISSLPSIFSLMNVDKNFVF